MGFRITATDRQTGRPVASYDTRTGSEAEARAEAERLGVEVVALEAIEPPGVGTSDVTGPSLADWNALPLRWRVTPWTLVRLGFEHPRWGRWLYLPLAVSASLIRTKVLPKMLAATLVAAFAAIGIQADPGTVLLLLMPVLLFGPLLAIKPYVFSQLRRHHARAGFDFEQHLRAGDGELHYYDGRLTQVISIDHIAGIDDLPRFVLLSTRRSQELAIPKSAFHSAIRARRFVLALAAAAGIAPRLDYRSEWVGERKPTGPAQQLVRTLALVLLVIAVVFLLVAVSRIVFR